MTIHEANMRLLFELNNLYDAREASNIADFVMENVTGWKRIDRVMNKEVKMSASAERQLENYTKQLLTHKPVQYVLHEAWFAGMKLYVDENVLIPRPETEELVDLLIKDYLKQFNASNTPNRKKSILDIGTGSGCIPIALKKKLREPTVYAVDISEMALGVAKRNAELNDADIEFKLCDILDKQQWENLPTVDIIASNPPYIPYSEKSMMHGNVTAHEPHVALFVPDNDPLIFYKAIAQFAKIKLLPGGMIYLEMHESLGESVKDLFSFIGEVQIKNDMQGKQRFLIAGRRTYQP